MLRSLAKYHHARLPQPGSIIASSHTSPIDSVYLAAIFDPIFTASYPSTRLVQQISLFHAMLRAFQHPQYDPPPNAKLTDLETLIQQHPNRAIVVYPECTTTNGKAILPFSSSILTAPSTAKIFPISLRYTAADITTPVPNTYTTFLWNLLSKPTHCIRVRIAESIHHTSHVPATRGTAAQIDSQLDDSSSDTLSGLNEAEGPNAVEKKVLDRVAEALARLGRVKRVGLNLKDKEGFVKTWTKHKRR